MNSNNIILIKKSTEEVCWTCNKKPATKSEYRDSLGENEMTCADCHRQEYPEQYEDEELCKNCDATYTGRKEPFCIMGHKNCEKGLPHITTLCDEDEEEEATICWDGETCKPDEFGCCVVCCECKACICNLQKAEEEEED